MRTRSSFRFALGLSGLLCAPALLTTTACGSLGDRASTGGCPAGEVCNPDTPHGLRFYGAGAVGTLASSPGPIAVGGQEHIRFEDPTDPHRPLPVSHVVSSNPTVLDASRPGSALGLAEGTANLRVLDDENRLLDRLTITVAPIASVDVVGVDDGFVALAELSSHAPVVLAPGVERIGIALIAANGVRLVDDAATVTSDATITAEAWDTIGGSFGAADVPLTVHAGGASFEIVARAAGPIDDVELVTTLLGGPSDTPVVSAGDTVCAIPRSGGARVVGSPVHATYRVDGTAVPADDAGRCIALPATLGATVSIEVSFDGVTRTFDLPVEASSGASPMPLVADHFTLPRAVSQTLGARARLAWGLD